MSNIINKMRILGYALEAYPADHDRIDNIVSPDHRRRKYSDRQILKILILLQISDISYRSSGIFLTSHEEYLRMIGLKEIPSFQTLSRRSRSMDLHAMNRSITLLHTMKECAAIDSFMINTCKYSTAMRRKYWGNYKDPGSGWSKTTKRWSYGRKCHMTLDVDSLLRSIPLFRFTDNLSGTMPLLSEYVS